MIDCLPAVNQGFETPKVYNQHITYSISKIPTEFWLQHEAAQRRWCRNAVWWSLEKQLQVGVISVFPCSLQLQHIISLSNIIIYYPGIHKKTDPTTVDLPKKICGEFVVQFIEHPEQKTAFKSSKGPFLMLSVRCVSLGTGIEQWASRWHRFAKNDKH